MHEYDIALKSVLRRLTGSVLRELTGFTVARWHNTDLPAVQSRRADILGETAAGTLVHIELQSTNQAGMALRMLEYVMAIHRQFGRFPEQVVLYVGQARLRMKGEVKGPKLEFRCRMVDIREMDSERLIASSSVEDNVLAVLARLGDERAAVQQILRRIANCRPDEREMALDELMLLAGLRDLEPVITREANEMPILNDIMDHKVYGPLLRQGRKEGRKEGRIEGERSIIVRQIEQRFGSLSSSAKKRLEAMTGSKLERIALRLLDAESLDELLG